jgi:hypothetical protein
MEYFKSTALQNWPKEKVQEYFAKKGIYISLDQVYPGMSYANARLITLRKLYDVETANKIFLLIRIRVEREEEILNQSYRNFSNLTPLTPRVEGISYPLDLSMSDIDLSRISTSQETYQTCVSNIRPDNLEEPEQTAENTENDLKMLEFIDRNPPILWEQEHLNLFLNRLGLFSTKIPCEEFIFMTVEQLENCYINYGQKIHDLLRSKFLNPNNNIYLKSTHVN